MKKTLLLITLVVFNLYAAVTRDAGKTGGASGAATTASYSVPSGVDAGHLVTASILTYGHIPAASELTTTGTATKGNVRLDTVYNSASFYVAQYSFPVQTTGTCTVVYTGTATCYPTLAVGVYNGIDTTTSRKRASNTKTGTGTAVTTTSVSATSGDLAIGFVTGGTTGTITWTQGGNWQTKFTQTNASNYSAGQACDSIMSADASISFESTIGASQTWVAGCVVYKAGSASCTPATITGATVTGIVGQSGKYGHVTANAFDSCKMTSTWPATASMVAYATKDSVTYTWTKKVTVNNYTMTIYSCAGVNTNTCSDNITIDGWTATYPTTICTAGVAKTISPTSTANADSFTISGAPSGTTINYSTGVISWTPSTTVGATAAKIIGWYKSTKSDSTTCTMSAVWGIVYLDSIRPSTIYYNQGYSLYGRGFGATQGSSTISSGGDSIPTITSWSNAKIDLINKNIAVDVYDIIITDGMTADTILSGYTNNGRKQFTLTVTTIGGISTPLTGLVDSGASTAIENFPSAGYRFSSWGVGAGGTIGSSTSTNPNSVIITTSATVTATDTIVHYTLSYNANGGSGTVTDPSSPYDTNSTVTVLANGFTRTGYTFSKWNTAANGSGTDYAPDATFAIKANTILYAQWTINTYTMAYNSNGGSGSMTDPSSPYNYNSTVTVLSNSFTKMGYNFVKWNTQAGGGGVDYIPAATFSIAANTTLYAQWAIKSYTLTMVNSTPAGTLSPTPGAHSEDSAANVTLSYTHPQGYRGAGYTSTGGIHFNPDSTAFWMSASGTLTAACTTMKCVVTVTASGPGRVGTVTSPKDSGVVFAITADSGNASAAPWDSFAHWSATGGAVIASTTTRHTTMYLTANGTAQALFGVRAGAAPTLYFPANGDTGVNKSATLRWRLNAVDSAYIVEIDTAATFNSALLQRDTLTDTTWAVTLTRDSTVYSWRGYGLNSGGKSSASAAWTAKTARPAINSGIYFGGVAALGLGLGAWFLMRRRNK
jgi:uncharacterized repeat protein (TIGR02543 family)